MQTVMGSTSAVVTVRIEAVAVDAEVMTVLKETGNVALAVDAVVGDVVLLAVAVPVGSKVMVVA